MPSSVLKSKTSIEVNIRIKRAFNAMRSFLMNNATLFKRLETVELKFYINTVLMNLFIDQGKVKIEPTEQIESVCFFRKNMYLKTHFHAHIDKIRKFLSNQGGVTAIEIREW